MGAERKSAQAAKVSSPFDLTGRIVLVTGASRGLGAALAYALAAAGADVILWGRDTRALAHQARRLSRFPVRVLTQRVDVTDHAAVRRAVQRCLRKFHYVDVLVNNAGIWGGDAALTIDRRTWQRVIDTDFTSVFFVSQAVVRSMIKRRYGKIINISSTSGVIVHPEAAIYGTVKAGIIHMTRILALEWGPYGVRVNSIAPGVFRTDMTRDMYADRTWCRRRQSDIPLRRFGEPEDIGGLGVFLASSGSDHLTGQTIIIDGGACLTV